MHREWTPAVARALTLAGQYAFHAETAEVLPFHVLMGLLQEEESKAVLLLTDAGMALDRVRQSAPPPVDQLALPLSATTESTLVHALQLAREMEGESVVSSTALLLALLRGEENLRRTLENHGLDFARLEQDIDAAQEPPLELDEPLHLTEPTERIDTARVLDAGFNRAREALRVTEDYCRFVLDDAFLSGELKRLRHDLAAAAAMVPPALLLAGRETLRDVGTTISTARESERHSPPDVVHVNLKRLQEALRSLEEFGKVHHPDLGRALESLRYRAYTLERSIVLGTASRHRLADARLHVLLTGSLCSAALDWTIQEAAAGGASIFQLREKGWEDRRLLERAREVRRWTRKEGVSFILNDRPDLARLVEADGVHLGQDDLPVKEARRILGPDALIGVSTHNLSQVRQAILDGADYLGVGPAFPSKTKAFDGLAGLEFVRQALAETTLPAFVIGGVNRDTIDAAVKAGARRVAVSAAICQADNPQAEAAALLRRLTLE
ncbi:MAG TPA: thiamine phosphate synthase [Gemmataceae bacterium]|jgi:thiamine-phosphate pyrophosphorylase